MVGHDQLLTCARGPTSPVSGKRVKRPRKRRRRRRAKGRRRPSRPTAPRPGPRAGRPTTTAPAPSTRGSARTLRRSPHRPPQTAQVQEHRPGLSLAIGKVHWIRRASAQERAGTVAVGLELGQAGQRGVGQLAFVMVTWSGWRWPPQEPLGVTVIPQAAIDLSQRGPAPAEQPQGPRRLAAPARQIFLQHVAGFRQAAFGQQQVAAVLDQRGDRLGIRVGVSRQPLSPRWTQWAISGRGVRPRKRKTET